MTVALKELDGSRTTEIEHKDGIVYFDGGSPRHCFAFDAGLLLRAIERELDVKLLRDAFVMSMMPCGGFPQECAH